VGSVAVDGAVARNLGVAEGSETRQRRTERPQDSQQVATGGKPWTDESGVQAVVDAVRDLAFPIDRGGIIAQAGEREVSASSHLDISLRELMEKVPEDDFETIDDFQTAVMRHWDGIRYLEVPPEQRPRPGGPRPRAAAKKAQGAQRPRKVAASRASPKRATSTKRAKTTRVASAKQARRNR